MDAPATIPIRPLVCDPPIRGVGWVLRQAAALAVLAIAAVTLLEFGYRLAAERALTRAAESALAEAALPRATRHSVEQSIRTRLEGRYDLGRDTAIMLQRNRWLLRGTIRPQAGDRLTVALTVPVDAALPRWLRAATFWNNGAKLVVRAESR